MGATRVNNFPARRTRADKRQVIIPGREPIRTALIAIQPIVALRITGGCAGRIGDDLLSVPVHPLQPQRDCARKGQGNEHR